MPPHRLLTVVRVIESAEADSITGKFETKAQILGMRLAKQVCCRPNTTVSKKSIKIFLVIRISPIFPKTIAITEIFGKLIIM